MPGVRRSQLGVLAAAVLMLLGLAVGGQAQAGAGFSAGFDAGFDARSLQASTPKTVVLDPASGAVLSVSTERLITPLISNRNICHAGDGCYYTGRIPYAHQGFYGTRGTFHGSWPYRSSWFTGNYIASACWVGACSQFAFGPNTTVTFGGVLVTGTSFTIH